jgi:hypothetical protein
VNCTLRLLTRPGALLVIVQREDERVASVLETIEITPEVTHVSIWRHSGSSSQGLDRLLVVCGQVLELQGLEKLV